MDLNTFGNRLGVDFKNISLLETAFTHRSYINENRGQGLEHNERLEFLGDAVLELAVTAFLFEKFPKKTEGDLTAFRAALVNTDTLSGVSTELGFNDFLRLSKGESKDTGRARHYILANTYEAVVGAIYMDQGYDAAQQFISRTIFPLLDEVVKQGSWIDAKSMFQEKAQENESVTPLYQTLHEEGPDHDKYFTVGVFLNDKKVAEGRGHSKQEAEQEAARGALEAKNWLSK